MKIKDIEKNKLYRVIGSPFGVNETRNGNLNNYENSKHHKYDHFSVDFEDIFFVLEIWPEYLSYNEARKCRDIRLLTLDGQIGYTYMLDDEIEEL